jgi:type VI secretion system secreted protein Hcp
MIDAYLQIDGIKGESTDDKHKDWIEVSHVNWGVHQPSCDRIDSRRPHQRPGRVVQHPVRQAG